MELRLNFKPQFLYCLASHETGFSITLVSLSREKFTRQWAPRPPSQRLLDPPTVLVFRFYDLCSMLEGFAINKQLN